MGTSTWHGAVKRHPVELSFASPYPEQGHQNIHHRRSTAIHGIPWIAIGSVATTQPARPSSVAAYWDHERPTAGWPRWKAARSALSLTGWGNTLQQEGGHKLLPSWDIAASITQATSSSSGAYGRAYRQSERVFGLGISKAGSRDIK